MLILFQTLDYILFTNIPSFKFENPETPITPITSSSSDKPSKTDVDSKKKFLKENNIVWGQFLNNASNSLLNNFVNEKFAKDIWDLLKKRYGRDYAGKKKKMR